MSDKIHEHYLRLDKLAADEGERQKVSTWYRAAHAARGNGASVEDVLTTAPLIRTTPARQAQLAAFDSECRRIARDLAVTAKHEKPIFVEPAAQAADLPTPEPKEPVADGVIIHVDSRTGISRAAPPQLPKEERATRAEQVAQSIERGVAAARAEEATKKAAASAKPAPRASEKPKDALPAPSPYAAYDARISNAWRAVPPKPPKPPTWSDTMRKIREQNARCAS
jgi:hypothetical protein